jgi:predicted nucleic acid-binding protein
MAAPDQGAQLAMKRWLVDTGPFVAYLDREDPMHDAVAARLDGFTGQLATTGAVVTEAMYFLSDAPDGPLSFAELLLNANAQIVEALQPRHVLLAASVMKKYGDTPMDFADATLVALAEDLEVMDILTLDRRGFSTYRTSTGRRFRLVLNSV